MIFGLKKNTWTDKNLPESDAYLNVTDKIKGQVIFIVQDKINSY